MADTLKRYYSGTLATTNTNTNIVSAGSAGGVVRNIHICNTTSAAVVVNMSLGNSSATAYTAGSAIYAGFSVPANGVHVANVNIVMGASDRICAYAGGTGVVATISGVDL